MSTEGLVFTSRNQSLYESNVTETNTVSVRFEQPWDIAPVDYRLDLTRIEIFPERPLYAFGELIAVIPAVTIDLETEFEFYFDTSGKVGIEFGARADRGSINSEFIYEPSLSYDSDLRYPDAVLTSALIGTDGAAVAGAFDTNPFGLSAYMDFLYRFGLELDLGLRLFGNDIIPISNPRLNVNLPVDVPLLPQQRNPENSAEIEGTWRLVNYSNTTFEAIEFVFADIIADAIGNEFLASQFLEQVIGLEEGIGGKYYALALDILDSLEVTLTVDPYNDKFEVVLGPTAIRSKDNKLDRGQGLLTYDLGSITFNIPTPLPTDSSLENGKLEGSDSDLILAPRFDLDGIAAYAVTKATGYPIATEYNLYLGQMFQINLSILDIDVGPDLRWRQDLELTPSDLQVRFDFTDLNGNPAFVGIPDGAGGVNEVSSWTGPWESLPALAMDGPVIVTPSYQMASTLNNKTGFELGFGLDFLIGRLGLIVREEKTNIKLFNEALGPLFEISVTDQDFFETNDLFFPVIDTAGIQVGGYDVLTGTPILLDVEGSPRPGLSGFVTDLNIFDPVAVADDGFTVEKDGTLVFAPGALLLNDYDPDAFDTLRLARVGNLRDEDGDARGSVTLRPDGSVVFDTAGMFDTLSAEFVFGDDGLSVERDSARVTFDYEVLDAVGHEAVGKVVIDVLGRNTLPVAAEDFLSVSLPAAPGELTFPTSAILANDRDSDRPEADPADDETPLFRIGPSFGQTTTGGGTIRIGETDFGYLTLPSAVASLSPGEVFFDSFTYEIRDAAMFDDQPGVVGTVNVAFVAPGSGGQALWSQTEAPSVTAGSGSVPVAFLLGTAISGPVTVAVSAPIETGITLIGEILTFTPETAAIPQTVMVSSAELVPEPITLIGEIISAPSDPALLGQQLEVPLTVAAPAEIVVVGSLTQLEGPASGTALVTLARAPAPGTEVVLALSVRDPGNAAEISPASLTFTAENWQTGLPISVTPVDDTVATGPQIVDITLSVDAVATTDPAFAAAPDANLSVTILEDENAAPLPVFDQASVAEDGTLLIQPLDNDNDPDGDALSLVAVTANHGTVTWDAQTITYTPDADFAGLDQLQYTVTDGDLTAAAPIEVTVTPVDDPLVTLPGFAGGHEDQPITVDLSQYVRDVDGDALSFEALASQNGSAVLDGARLTFTPDPDFFNAVALRDVSGALRRDAEGEPLYQFLDPVSPAFVTWTVSDGTTSEEQTLLFAIAPQNDAPILPEQIDFATDEDTGLTIDLTRDVLAQAIDPEGEALTLIGVDIARPADQPQPFFYDPEAATVQFDPAETYASLAPGETATERFTYVIEDAFGVRSEAVVAVEIAGRNDAPEAVRDAIVLRMPLTGGTALLGDLTANDTDAEGDALVAELGPASAISPVAGFSRLGASVEIGPDGAVSYTPSGLLLQSLRARDVFFDSFDYLPVDSAGAASEGPGSVTVVLVGEAVPPGLIMSRTEVDAQEGALDAVVEIGLSAAPSKPITVLLSSIRPDETYPEVDQLIFTPEDWSPKPVRVIAVDDGMADGLSAAFIRVEIAPNDDPDYSAAAVSPQFLSVNVEDRGPGIRLSKSHVSLTENGPGETIAVTLTAPPEGGVTVRPDLAGTANFTVVPAALTFTTFDYLTPQYVTILPVDDDVADGVGLDFIRFEVDPDQSEAGYHAATPATLLAIVEDDDALPLPESPELAPVIRARAVEGHMREGTGGTSELLIRLTREGDLTEPSVLDWAVTGTGSAFSAAPNDFAGGAFPSGQVTFAAGVASLLIAVGIAPDAEEERDEWFALALTPLSNARTEGRAFEASIRNDDGDSGAVPATVLEVHLADPVAEEGATVSGELRRVGDFIGEITVILESSDPARATLPTTITLPFGVTSTAFEISVADNTTRDGAQFVTISARPEVNFQARSGGATLKITDDEANRAPVAVADAYATEAKTRDDPDAMLQLDLLANDSDPDGDALQIISLDLDGFQGQLFERGDGRLAYDPGAAFDGLGAAETATDRFRYRIEDDNGLTSDAEVTITILGSDDTAANRVPVPGDDLTFVTDARVPIVLTGLLDNDSDPDGDPLAIYALGLSGLVGAVEFGLVDSVLYDPSGKFDDLEDGEQAVDRFTYSVEDGKGGRATAEVAVTIRGTSAGVNAAPIAGDDRAATLETEAFVIDAGANDFDPEAMSLLWSDPDTSETAGTVTSLGLGQYLYNPGTAFAALGAGEAGEDLFRYSVTDPDGRSSTATVTVTVSGDGPAGLPPVAGNDFAATDSETAIVIDVRNNDSDPDGDALTWDVLDTTMLRGAVEDNGDGTFTYTPATGFSDLEQGLIEADMFRYRVTDATGASDTATVIVTISGTAAPNEAPVGVADRGDATQGLPFLIDVLANDTDPDGDALSIFSIDAPLSGGISLEPGGLRYAPAAGFLGSEVFGYTLSDGSLSGTAAVTVTVAPDGMHYVLGSAADETFAGSSASEYFELGGGADTLNLIDGFLDGDTVHDFGVVDRITLPQVTHGAVTITAGVSRTLLTIAHGGEGSTELMLNGDFREQDWILETIDGESILRLAGGTSTVLTPEDDRFISGDPGENIVFGNDGDDVILAGAGADDLLGGGGSDLLIGSDGVDRFLSGSGNDLMRGGQGSDRFHFAQREDIAFSINTITDFEPGVDRITFDGFGDGPHEIRDLQSGAVVFFSGTEAVLLEGVTSQDLQPGDVAPSVADFRLDTIRATTGHVLTDADDRLVTNDTAPNIVIARGGADVIVSGAGNDQINAGDGSDLVLAGDGDDLIRGGGGNDLLTGGAGADIFVFAFDEETGFTVDTIDDFNPMEDQVLLEGFGIQSSSELTVMAVDDGLLLTVKPSHFLRLEGMEDAATLLMPDVLLFT